MARERYGISSEVATSGSADTNTFPWGVQSAASRGFQIYEVISALKAAASDTRHISEVSAGVTTAFTGNSAITPVPIYIGGAAATSAAHIGFSVAPTPAALPMLRLPHNGRATVRWAAIDPDAGFVAQAAGGLNGQLFGIDRNSGAAAIGTEHHVFFSE
jgi:hypothetical protein